MLQNYSFQTFPLDVCIDCFQSHCNVFQMGMMRGQGIEKNEFLFRKAVKRRELEKAHSGRRWESEERKFVLCDSTAINQHQTAVPFDGSGNTNCLSVAMAMTGGGKGELKAFYGVCCPRTLNEAPDNREISNSCVRADHILSHRMSYKTVIWYSISHVRQVDRLILN